MSIFLRIKSHTSLVVDESSCPRQMPNTKTLFLCLCYILNFLFILWDSLKKKLFYFSTIY